VSISSCPLTPQPHAGLLRDEVAWPLRLCRRQRNFAVWDLTISADRLMSAESPGQILLCFTAGLLEPSDGREKLLEL
jgi:hypothetical protein